MSKPLVSVWCSAYNHQKYIAQAIEGFVMQRTDFEIEIFLHDDASTDETANIIREYAAKYPQIKAICLTENKFSVDKSYLNRIMFEKTRGKYIAMCEGDDFWTDPLKLQKQVDFLEANPDFAICFHRVKVIYEDGMKDSHPLNLEQKEITTFDDLALGNYIHTPSCVFRNGLFEKFPDWFYQSPVGDWVLHLLNAQYGKIKFLDSSMAAYRVHEGGLWSGEETISRIQKWIEVVEACRKHFAPRSKENFARAYAHNCTNLCFHCFNEGKYSEFRKYYFNCLEEIKYIGSRSLFALTVRYFLSFMPFAANYYKVRKNVKSAVESGIDF